LTAAERLPFQRFPNPLRRDRIKVEVVYVLDNRCSLNISIWKGGKPSKAVVFNLAYARASHEVSKIENKKYLIIA
jgi:hypothetical protein